MSIRLGWFLCNVHRRKIGDFEKMVILHLTNRRHIGKGRNVYVHGYVHIWSFCRWWDMNLSLAMQHIHCSIWIRLYELFNLIREMSNCQNTYALAVYLTWQI
jgi:hypothetical protein